MSSQGNILETFRASGDELLIDRLVKCRRCGLEYVSPRPRGGDSPPAFSGSDPVTECAFRVGV